MSAAWSVEETAVHAWEGRGGGVAPVKRPAAPRSEKSGASGSSISPVMRTRCAMMRPRQEPRRRVELKEPEGSARPPVHAAEKKYATAKSTSARSVKSSYRTVHSDLMLSPARGRRRRPV